MTHTHATLRLDTPSCPAVAELGPRERVRCIQRGDEGGDAGGTLPVAHVRGDAPGWDSLAACRDGRFARRTEACRACPVQALPSDLVPLDVEATQAGLRIEVAAPDDTTLADAYHRLRVAGQRPRIVRGGRSSATGAPAPGAYVHLDHLSRRQREALEAAQRIGYFEVGGGGVDALAAELGCGRSAAHEHLRRGMARLLDAVF